MNTPRLLNLDTHRDPRGCLTAIEGGQGIPFDIKRVFYMHHIVEPRGGHAHIDTDQVLIAVSGSFKVDLFDGLSTRHYVLDDCTRGLYIPRLHFTDMYDFTPDAVGLVLCSTHYDITRSLRSRDEFVNWLASRDGHETT